MVFGSKISRVAVRHFVDGFGYTDDQVAILCDHEFNLGNPEIKSDFIGYSVESRTISIEALEMFKTRSEEFDLVITDMTMPNLTGDRLAAELMKIRTDIPVILCTGFSEQISEKYRRLGLAGCRHILGWVRFSERTSTA